MAEKKTPDISRYTFDTTESIFKNFEPYHCGIPAITDGFTDFETDPEKCNETNNFQKYVVNGFTNEIRAEKLIESTSDKYYSYQNNNTVLTGCEKGTVVLANRPTGVGGGFALVASGSTDTEIKVTVENDGNHLIIGSLDLKEANFNTRGLVFPKRLGILLVGGGGGAGGLTKYDAKKDGKAETKPNCWGGSGGGGGTIWGVVSLNDIQNNGKFSIKKIATAQVKYNSNEWKYYLYKAKLKTGEDHQKDYTYIYFSLNDIANIGNDQIKNQITAYFKHSGWDRYPSTKHYIVISRLKEASAFGCRLNDDDIEFLVRYLYSIPKSLDGNAGIDGGIYPNDHTLTHDNPQKGTNGIAGANLELQLIDKDNKATTIATAFGGGGGSAGHWSNIAIGGIAGGSKVSDDSKFIECGRLTGLAGINAYRTMSLPEATMPERSKRVQFFEVNKEAFCFNINNTKLVGIIDPAGDGTAVLPGGHSYSNGKTKLEPAEETYGSGGCSGGIVNTDNEASDIEATGGDVYWAVYY